MDKTRLIYKVLSGAASESEQEELKRWVESDPGNAEEFQDIKLLHEADASFDESKVVGDERFYDGLRTIRERITILDRRRKKTERYKTIGTALLISSFVFGVLFVQVSLTARTWQLPDLRGDASTVSLSGTVTFENTTLGSIFHMLDSDYGIVIRVESRDVLSCRFTGTFYRGIPVDDMLRVLAHAENLDITLIEEGTFEVSGKGCSR